MGQYMKMNYEIAEAIRGEYHQGSVTQAQLALKYHQSQGNIYKIIKRDIWNSEDRKKVHQGSVDAPLMDRMKVEHGFCQLSSKWDPILYSEKLGASND